MRTSRMLVPLAAFALFAIAGCDFTGTAGPGEAVVYAVTETGVGSVQADALATELGVPTEGILSEAGIVAYVDPLRHLMAPMESIEPVTVEPDEDYAEPREVDRALSVASVDALTAPSEDEAIALFRGALEEAGLTPDEVFTPAEGGVIGAAPATLVVTDPSGSTVAEGTVHVRAGIRPALDGHPYVGPGATAVASFAHDDDGRVITTALRFSWRDLEPSDTVELLSTRDARERCRARLNGDGEANLGEVALDAPRLVYYAPSLDDPAADVQGPRSAAVDAIVPHYLCGGTAMRPGGEEVVLGQSFVPATDDPAYVPTVSLDAFLDGDVVNASVDIEGGRPPYTIRWQSNHRSLDPPEYAVDAIAYQVFASDKEIAEETVSVVVTDANGIRATAAATLGLDAAALSTRAPSLAPTAGGVVDFGSEAVSNKGWGKGVNDKFEREMRAAGVTQRFVWDGVMGWERDFRDPYDATWADNADITYLSGHGWPGGVGFVDEEHDDGNLRRGGEAHGDWGDLDLEWLTLASCNVLEKNYDSGVHVVDRWGQEFDGLHMALGFHTKMQLWSNLGRDFANNLTGDFGGPFVNVNVPVVASWFLAIEMEQPFNEGAVMGPIRSDGLSNYGDYFHGYGTVGPDIAAGEIDRFWVLSEGSYQDFDF